MCGSDWTGQILVGRKIKSGFPAVVEQQAQGRKLSALRFFLVDGAHEDLLSAVAMRLLLCVKLGAPVDQESLSQ